jgi:hypothetical protein
MMRISKDHGDKNFATVNNPSGIMSAGNGRRCGGEVLNNSGLGYQGKVKFPPLSQSDAIKN